MNINNKSITAFFAAFMMIFCHQSFASINKTNDEISYIVTIDKNNHKVAKVTATFIPQNKFLYMFPGANNFPKRWAEFVSDLKVMDHNDQPIKVTELDDAKWSLDAVTNKPIKLNYQVNLEHEKHQWSGGVDGAAYARDWGVFYTGRSLFIANGENRSDIKVSFNLPPNWHVTTPWLANKNDKKIFKVNNLTELSTSIIFAGLHKEISIKRGEFELVLAIGGKDLIARQDEFKNLAKGVFDYYAELMGGIPNPSPGNKLTKSVVVINPGSSTDGEALGNNISILIEENGGQMSEVISRFIFAHEFFHLWSGKSFAPIYDDTEWFKEGFSNYYTLKSLHHVGFLNDESYLSLLANFFYQKYDSDDGVGKLSMTNGEEKHDHWGLIYAGGFFVGISQDMIIRNATSNEKSLDDLMRTLFNKYGGTDGGYTLEELIIELSALSKADQTVFFDSYVKGVNRVPLVEYLKMAGISSTNVDGRLVLTSNKLITPNQKKLQRGLFGIQNIKQ